MKMLTMKNIILKTIIFLLPINAICQTNTAEITFKAKREDISEIVELGGDGGFLVHTSSQYAKYNKNSVIHFFSPDLKNNWSVSIPKATNSGNESFLLANELSDYVYYIQKEKGSRFSKGEFIINRIGKNGQLESFNYDINKQFEKADKVASFVDDKGLYFVLKTKNQHVKGQKRTATIQVYFMDHSRKKFDIIKTDMKDLSAESDEAIFVEFAGVDKEYIYLSQKWLSVKENAMKYVYYKLNKERFHVDDEKEFVVQIEDELVASVNSRKTDGARVYDNDYEVESWSNGRTTYITYLANAGSFGCAKLDVKSKSLYIYGITSGKKFNPKIIKSDNGKKDKKGKKVELIDEIGGGYLIKFDFETSKELSRNEFTMQKNLTKDIAKIPFYSRSIWFDILPNDKYRLSLTTASFNILKLSKGVTASIVTCIIPEKGKADVKSTPIPMAMNFRPNHTRYLTNTTLNKSFAPKAAIDFIAKNEKIRYPDYSIFGIYLSNKFILAKNSAYTKSAKLELTSYDFIQ